MNVTKISPRGFCMGVTRAIWIARKTARENPGTPIYTLGMLVHNRHVVSQLEKEGIRPLDTSLSAREEWIDSLDGGILLLTAHGTPQSLVERAQKRGLKVVDATCMDVRRTAGLLKSRLAEGYDILYIGKKGHPEADAMLSIDPSRVQLVEAGKPFSKGRLPKKPYSVICQTTLSMLDVQNRTKEIREAFPDCRVEPEICSATYQRQKAVLEAEGFDAIFVVGDPSSNNTRMLAQLAEEKAPRVWLVEDEGSLPSLDLSGIRRAAVTAGASTPDDLIESVCAALEKIN